jgi:hypothetical protein
MTEAERTKPRVSLPSFRLLEHLWPYAREYAHNRSEIVADIFDGWMTPRDMAPMLADGLVYEVKSFDRSAPDGFRHYHSWNPTEKGERAIFGLEVRKVLEGRSHD